MQVPAPDDSTTVLVELEPSPQVTVQVCVSAVPASPNDAFAVNDVPVCTELPTVGEVTVTVGATFATVTRKLPLLERPVESKTVTLTVYGVARSLTKVCAAEI